MQGAFDLIRPVATRGHPEVPLTRSPRSANARPRDDARRMAAWPILHVSD